MPSINWEKLSEFKHALAQERTIICGIRMMLEKFNINKTINMLNRCDSKLAKLEDDLVAFFIEADNNGGNNGNPRENRDNATR